MSASHVFLRHGIFCARVSSTQKRRTNHPAGLRALSCREAPFAKELFRAGLSRKPVSFHAEALKLAPGVDPHGAGFPDGHAVFADAEVAVGKAAVRERKIPAFLRERNPPKRERGEGREDVALRHPLGLINLRKPFTDPVRHPEKNRDAQLMVESPLRRIFEARIVVARGGNDGIGELSFLTEASDEPAEPDGGVLLGLKHLREFGTGLIALNDRREQIRVDRERRTAVGHLMGRVVRG